MFEAYSKSRDSNHGSPREPFGAAVHVMATGGRNSCPIGGQGSWLLTSSATDLCLGIVGARADELPWRNGFMILNEMIQASWTTSGQNDREESALT